MREAIKELHGLGFVRAEGKQAKYLKQLMGLSNYEHMERAKGLLDTLAGYEKELKKQVGPTVVARVEQEPTSGSGRGTA